MGGRHYVLIPVIQLKDSYEHAPSYITSSSFGGIKPFA